MVVFRVEGLWGQNLGREALRGVCVDRLGVWEGSFMGRSLGDFCLLEEFERNLMMARCDM